MNSDCKLNEFLHSVYNHTCQLSLSLLLIYIRSFEHWNFEYFFSQFCYEQLKSIFQPILMKHILLLDSVNQSTIITRQCANKIGLHITPSSLLLNDISTMPILDTGKLNMYTINGQLFKNSHEVIVGGKIRDHLPQFSKFPELQSDSTSDPDFNNSPQFQ